MQQSTKKVKVKDCAAGKNARIERIRQGLSDAPPTIRHFMLAVHRPPKGHAATRP